MPLKYEVRDVNKVLERAGFQNMEPLYDSGRMIVEQRYLALKDEMNFCTRTPLAPHGLEEVELRYDGRILDAAGP